MLLRSGAQSFVNRWRFLKESRLYGDTSDNHSIYLGIMDEGIVSIVGFDLRIFGGRWGRCSEERMSCDGLTSFMEFMRCTPGVTMATYIAEASLQWAEQLQSCSSEHYLQAYLHQHSEFLNNHFIYYIYSLCTPELQFITSMIMITPYIHLLFNMF